MTDAAALPPFDDEAAARLDDLLRARPGDEDPAPGWLDAAGFLLAVACAPVPVPADEWLETLLTPAGQPVAPVDPATEAAVLLQRLHAAIAADLEAGAPRLPPGCEPRADALDNFASAAPLAQWARGFERGHAWLADDWDVRLPADAADALDDCYTGLVFFADPDVAADIVLAATGDPAAAAAYAADVIAGLPAAMAGYAAAGVFVGERHAAAARQARTQAARVKEARRRKAKAQRRSRKAHRR